MKKVLSILIISLLSFVVLPFNVAAKSVKTLDVTESSNKITISGTTESDVLAVAVFVYSGTELVNMETCSNNSDNYSCELNKTFTEGSYVVKVADYNGGDYISKDITITKADVINPKTIDNIIIYSVVGVISLVGIIGCTLYFKKTMKKNN